jgi:glutathione S-transferase
MTSAISHGAHGSGLSLADIAVGCALGYVSFRLGDIRWREQYPNLAQLYEKTHAASRICGNGAAGLARIFHESRSAESP